MHFVREHAGQKLIRASWREFSKLSGEQVATHGAIWLVFERGTAPEWAASESIKHFKFDGRPRPGSIGGADIAVDQWVVYVDTEEWAKRFGHSDEIRKLAEEALAADPESVEVLPPALRPPWPNYDKLTVTRTRTGPVVAERNLETAMEIGVDVADMIAYEEATLMRDEVLAAYREAQEKAQVPEDADAATVVVA